MARWNLYPTEIHAETIDGLLQARTTFSLSTLTEFIRV